MMQQAVQDGRISQEVFTKKHSHCNHAVLAKQFFCDSSCTLHHPAGLGECDFGDSYDCAAHTPTSIALQSWGILKSAIRVLLSSMQTTQYVLKTGFGESEECYGGTESSPNSGLGQGSGASPPAFIALRPDGTQRKNSLILFWLPILPQCCDVLDDTDLLHWPEYPATDPKEYIEHVQWATMYYGNLAQATGGILKEKKCSVYFLDYKFVLGHEKMKSLHNLPPPRVYVMDKGCIYLSYISIP
jgi:hypothetical protein